MSTDATQLRALSDTSFNALFERVFAEKARRRADHGPAWLCPRCNTIHANHWDCPAYGTGS
jgi:rubrerythrin